MKINKSDWISFVNVVSCVAVVFLHTNGCFWTFSTEPYWVSANIIECIFYFAVPCFFMITGATLMDYRERYSLKTYCRKRTEKTIIPYIIWSLIGIVYSLAVGGVNRTEISVSYICDALLYGKAVGIYWFFPSLFGLYMTLPVLSAVEQKLRKNCFILAALGLFAFGIAIPFVLRVVGSSIIWNDKLNVQMGGYVIYLLLGYLISEYHLDSWQRKVIYILGGAGLLMHIIGTYYLSMKAGEIVETYKGYLNLPCVLYSTAIFSWCRYNADRLMRVGCIRKVVQIVNPYTLSIYLLQYFIYATAITMLNLDTTSLAYRLGGPFGIVFIAIVVTIIVRKIPLAKAMLP